MPHERCLAVLGCGAEQVVVPSDAWPLLKPWRKTTQLLGLVQQLSETVQVQAPWMW